MEGIPLCKTIQGEGNYASTLAYTYCFRVTESYMSFVDISILRLPHLFNTEDSLSRNEDSEKTLASIPFHNIERIMFNNFVSDV